MLKDYLIFRRMPNRGAEDTGLTAEAHKEFCRTGTMLPAFVPARLHCIAVNRDGAAAVKCFGELIHRLKFYY